MYFNTNLVSTLSLRSELSGENRSGGGAPVKIKGLDGDEEEHEHSWGR